MASRKAISLRRLRVRNQKVPISPRNTFTNRNTTTTVCVFTLSTSPSSPQADIAARIRNNVGYEHIVGVQMRAISFRNLLGNQGESMFSFTRKQSALHNPVIRSVSHSRQFSGKPTLHRPIAIGTETADHAALRYHIRGISVPAQGVSKEKPGTLSL